VDTGEKANRAGGGGEGRCSRLAEEVAAAAVQMD
jgi:hypothetical protein